MKKFLSPETEPVRLYVYGVGVMILALLGVLGVVTDDLSKAIDGILVAALLIPGAEIARAKVDSPATSAAKDAALAEAEAVAEAVDEAEAYEPRHAAEG